MFESRCGVGCASCERKEQVKCTGCSNMEKPFWGGECPVKSCAEEKHYNHCGECPDFPCETVSTMGVEEGHDPKPRLENLKKWAGEEA